MSLADGNITEYEAAKQMRVDEYLAKLDLKIKRLKEDGRRGNSNQV